MSARLPHAIALAAALALLLAPPVSAGPLRKALRLAVRQAHRLVEARRAVEDARALRDRLVADSSTTSAPPARSTRPRTASEHRPRGTRP